MNEPQPHQLEGPPVRKGPRLNAEQYRELFEECHDAMAIIARDGTILDANHAASELFAWPHAEFLGMNIISVYANPEDRALYQEQVERDGFVRDFEVVFVTRDRRRLDCLLTTVVRRAPDGSVIGYQGIIFDVTERRRMEKQMHDYQRRLRSLTRELSQSAERERARIAAGIHDGVLQLVVAGQLKLKELQGKIETEDPLVAHLRVLFDQMANDLRTMTFDLSPPVLRKLGLVPGLEWLGSQIEGRYGLAVNLATEGKCEILDTDLRALAFRCIRELLLNVATHAGTDRAKVSLRREETHLQVTVIDEGRGFVGGQLGSFDGEPHFGLFSIRERLTLAGGRLDIESAPGKGTRCLLEIPFTPSEEEDGQ